MPFHMVEDGKMERRCIDTYQVLASHTDRGVKMFWGNTYHTGTMPSKPPFYADIARLEVVDKPFFGVKYVGYWRFHVPIADATQYMEVGSAN